MSRPIDGLNHLEDKSKTTTERRTIAMKESASRVRLLTVAEAAEQLGVKESTIRSWILKREKLEVVKVGRLVRITERSIQKLIDDNTIAPKEKN